MKIKKIITGLMAAISTATFAVGITASAAFTKEAVVEGIWKERWRGKRDDGTIYPEASYKYNLIVDWVEENYEEYSYASEMHTWEYHYDDYYDELTEHLDFNDDNNGNWTITTDTGEFYYFEFINGQWNQFDSNGALVDIFPPISTLLPGETMEDVEFDYDVDYEDEEFYYGDDGSDYADDSFIGNGNSDNDAQSDQPADNNNSTDRPVDDNASTDRPAGTQSDKQSNSDNKYQTVVSGTVNQNEDAVAETGVSATSESEKAKNENNNTTLIIVLGSLVVVAGGLGVTYVITKKKK